MEDEISSTTDLPGSVKTMDISDDHQFLKCARHFDAGLRQP
ncbi:MAG: hypothetical protein R6U13_01290 [Desulfatiglandaceae bacterium]